MERPTARIKAVPEDFVVEEIPAYEPTGAGEHLYVRFTKRDLTTDEAVRALCAALGADPRAAGAAGMKDKRAVTTQWISIATTKEPSAARELSLPGITVHDAIRHGNKLKPGHLAGNRFTIIVRDVPADRVALVTAALERAGREGLPNFFGAQRFGARGDNVEKARAWLTGQARPPRDAKMRRFMWSAVQSAVFDALLRERVQDGTWATPLEGDSLKRRSSGALFLCSDVQADRERAKSGEVSPTGPIPGVKMRAPEGAAAALERVAVEQILGADFDFAAVRALGEGSRRALRLWVEDMHVSALGHAGIVAPSGATEEQVVSLRVYFVLPKGAYATTVLASAVALVEPSRAND